MIPVWRDASALERALATLPPRPACEIVVATVIGEDAAYAELRAARPDVRWVATPRGRAVQMNGGAALASGRWLVFSHADCLSPHDLLRVVADADTRPGVVAGSFRLALDSADRRARVVEWGVRLRVALFDLPYGDQGIFVRREVFEALGGYRDLALMEDVELMGRLKRVGSIHHATSRVVTSARRWERDGWMARTAQNGWLAAQFLIGANPARLAQRYYRRRARAVVVMARAPWTRGKTRVSMPGHESRHAELREALFKDTLDVALSVVDAEHIVACDPPAAVPAMQRYADGAEVMAQRGNNLGDRIRHAFEDTFRLGTTSVVVIGSDLPDLPPRLLAEAFAALEADGTLVVIGPATDGGYYLIGMSRPRPPLFEGIAWGTATVLQQTLDAATVAGIRVHLLEQWHDIDAMEDLDRLVERRTDGALRTRAWRRVARAAGQVMNDESGPAIQHD